MTLYSCSYRLVVPTAFLILVGPLFLFCPSADALQAGAAIVDMTPPLGVPLNGYGYRMGRGATEVHDPLSVRALYLDDGETSLFLVSSDLCIINRELRTRVLELAPPVVAREHIILTATHNHSGPGGMSKALVARWVSGRFMPEVLEQTARRFAEAMRAAYESRRRASIGYGTTTQTFLSRHRRHDGGPIDTQIGVIRVDDADGNALAILANFAAHPTTVGKEYAYAISADYPGYFYTALEGLASKGCVAMLLNGAEGNQTCANPERLEGWARTESIGRLLAFRAKEVANSIECREQSLHIAYSEPKLPRTLAPNILPESTIIQSLEIDGLLINFFPGEPCVEIGLELRRRALARGYDAQFTVGLANDHLLYFVPKEYYGHSHYESAMNFYGPAMEDWLYSQFTALMTKGPASVETKKSGDGKKTPFAGGSHVLLSGSPYEVGRQRGSLFRREIQSLFERMVRGPLDDGSLIPQSGMWAAAPSFFNTTALALPSAAIGVRTLLAGLSSSSIDELLGMAEGARMPFDALWLAQCAAVYLHPGRMDGLYRAPFCTMFAATGDRAGAEGIRVARALDWSGPEAPTLIEVRPTSGHAYVHVGFPWNAGVFTGMNDAGLVVAVERVQGLGDPGFDGPPIEFVLRQILESMSTVGEAVEHMGTLQGVRGYHVLVAGPGPGRAVVVEFGDRITLREAANGLLLGIDPESDFVDDEARTRYRRVHELVKDERIIGTNEMEAVLLDQEEGRIGRARIFNEDTRHCVVFEPATRSMRVSFPTEDGRPGPFRSWTLREQAP